MVCPGLLVYTASRAMQAFTLRPRNSLFPNVLSTFTFTSGALLTAWKCHRRYGAWQDSPRYNTLVDIAESWTRAFRRKSHSSSCNYMLSNFFGFQLGFRMHKMAERKLSVVCWHLSLNAVVRFPLHTSFMLNPFGMSPEYLLHLRLSYSSL